MLVMDKFVGKRLDGRYEIREIIGVGGMAVVYKAYDCIEDRIVAVKILKEEFISNEEFITRFKNESKAIAVLNHPNIVKVYDVSFGDLIQYIVMEYVDGITLKQYIERQQNLRWKDAVYLTIQVLRALQHAHDKGIVHRDVKPQNIMLLSDGTIKVTDFGIARFARSEHKTMTDKAIGSVHYISPEQARGELTDEKADIYSVGVMLYEMLTGKLPFEADSAVSVAIMQLQQNPVLPRDINENIPVGLEQITMHAMQKDVAKRYRSAAEMLRDLEEFRRSPDMVFEYTYFVDNEPTRFVDAVNEADILGSSAAAEQNRVLDSDEDDDYEDEADEKSPVIPILAGVAIAFIIAAIVVGFIIIKSWNKDETESVVVPSFVGMTQDDVQFKYDADFTFKIDYRTSDTVPAGTVIEQSKPAGTSIKKTQTITLVISQGNELIEIPPVASLSQYDAVNQLTKSKFQVKIVEIHHDTVEAGKVVKTNPESGKAYYGAEIEVYVSIGPEIQYVNIVNCVGFTKEEAIKRIEAAGLTVGEITYEDVGLEKDAVVRQNPTYESNKQVVKGSKVDLVLDSGKKSYTHTLKVDDLPKNFKENYKVTLKAYKGGQLFESKEDVFLKDYDGSWTLNITGIDIGTKVDVKIYIAFDSTNVVEALVYTIDSTEKTDTVKVNTEKLKDYLAEASSQPNNPSSGEDTGGTT